jgi:hypothetical protein
MIPRIVLGFCAEVAAPEYTFAYVLAADHEGRLLKADFSMFPPQGSIYVPRSLFPYPIVRFRDLGFWDVEEDPNFGDRNRGAKYRAFRLRADAPAEIVRVDCPSFRADEVRQHLIERGLEAFYRLDGRDLMLEFADGVTAGPVRVEPADDDGRFRCHPECLGQPLGAWPNRGALQPVLVNMGQTARWFVWPRPRSESFIDLASTRQVLDSLQDIGISQALYDDLVRKLSFIDHASLVPPLHRKRLQVLLDEALTTGKQLEACVPLLRDDPRMREAVEQHKRQVGEEYRRYLERQKSQLRDEVVQLEARKKTVEYQIEEVRRRLVEEEALKEKTAESVAEAVYARVRQAQKEVHGLLAEVAVLRPFLSNSDAARALAGETHRHEAVALAGIDAAYAHLKNQLENVGLQPHSASATARETLTALSLGQAAFLQGSMAAVLARVIASSLSGARWTEWDVPADLKDGTLVKPVVDAAAAPEAPTMLILNGANRSRIDAYGSDLIRILAERAAGTASTPGLMLMGVLSEGLGAAPSDMALTALGPILHTDYLAWKRGWKAGPTKPGQLAAGPWPHPDGPVETTLETLLEELQPTPNELWVRNVLAAHRRLMGWSGRPGALESVLFGWVLPRCAAAGVDLSEYVQAFDQLCPESEEMDTRWRLFLKSRGYLPSPLDGSE